MDLEIIIINKDTERHIIWYTCMWDLKKKNTNELIYKNKNRLTNIENKLTVTKGGG